MGRRPSRYDLSAARREYVAALQRWHQAMTRFFSAGVPLSAEQNQVMRPWTAEQARAVMQLRDSLVALVESRRVYELLLRDELD